MKNQDTPESAALPIATSCQGDPHFNLKPLLELIKEESPAYIGERLEEIYNMLTDYVVQDASANGLHFVNVLYDLRQIRDAFRKGVVTAGANQ